MSKDDIREDGLPDDIQLHRQRLREMAQAASVELQPAVAALKDELNAAKREAADATIVRHGSVIAVDFDGTVVTHEYPHVGLGVPYCFEVLKQLEANGARFILWTMRSGQFLQDAVDWFERKGTILFGVNVNPEQSTWTDSPKAYAPVYIDDAALGCPLIYPTTGRPYVDWQQIEKHLQERNLV